MWTISDGQVLSCLFRDARSRSSLWYLQRSETKDNVFQTLELFSQSTLTADRVQIIWYTFQSDSQLPCKENIGQFALCKSFIMVITFLQIDVIKVNLTCWATTVDPYLYTQNLILWQNQRIMSKEEELKCLDTRKEKRRVCTVFMSCTRDIDDPARGRLYQDIRQTVR